MNEKPEIRKVAVKSLGLASLISEQIAKTYFMLFIQVNDLL